jgi:hypothetical protein
LYEYSSTNTVEQINSSSRLQNQVSRQFTQQQRLVALGMAADHIMASVSQMSTSLP